MDLLLIPRQPLRVGNFTSAAKRTARCEARGHCGPFANQALYDAFPEAMWHGMGDCLECGTTCHVQREIERRDAAPIASVA
ncbi:MAG: hypothetical protein KY464_06475 [Gemmatimonadetes bacterium]|nr:hypothetical protein [Gemmatimonadota bacterium]